MRYRIGIRRVSALVSHVAAATPATQYILSPGRVAVVRKVMVRNRSGNTTHLQLGTGLGGLFAARLPGFVAVNGFDGEWTEAQIPEVEFGADITAQVSAAGAAPADVEVLIEVEEFQGATG